MTILYIQYDCKTYATPEGQHILSSLFCLPSTELVTLKFKQDTLEVKFFHDHTLYDQNTKLSPFFIFGIDLHGEFKIIHPQTKHNLSNDSLKDL